MRSKLTIPVFILTIISFCFLVYLKLFGANDNLFLIIPQALQGVLLEGFFMIMIFVFIGGFVLPVLSIIAVYNTYKNKLDGRILTIISLILSIINLIIVLTILSNAFNSRGSFLI